MSEADLWAAVMLQAVKDSLEVERVRGDTDGAGAGPSKRDVREAWAFLTERAGAWAESRELICGLNSVDASIARAEAIRRGPSRLARLIIADLPTKEGGRPGSSFYAKRNKEIAADYAAGMPMSEMRAKYLISENNIRNTANELRAYRPQTARSSATKAAQSAATAAYVAKQNTRNGEILQRIADGATTQEIMAMFGMSRVAVRHVVQRYGKRAGSAAGELGGANRAAGGGDVSFHGQSMQEPER